MRWGSGPSFIRRSYKAVGNRNNPGLCWSWFAFNLNPIEGKLL